MLNHFERIGISRITIVILVLIIIIGAGITIVLFGLPLTANTNSTTSPSSSSTTSSSFSATTISSSSVSTSTSFSPTTSSIVTSTLTSTTSSNSSTFANDWLTYHYNNSRDGSYPSSKLTTKPSLVWNSTVDAPVYAEPLYYGGYVYIATENNTVYALNGSSGLIAWSRHLGAPMLSLVPPLECDNNTSHAPNIQPTIGITGTPVIDPISGSIFVAALVDKEGYVMYSLNLMTGQLRWSSVINASGFPYLAEEQRGALAFANGLVYVPFAGYSWDCLTPVGWVFAMSPSGNGVKYHYNIPTTFGGTIWPPEGISVDSSGFVYVVSGDNPNATFSYGNSVIKLNPNLSMAGYFAASNWNYTNANDLDLGSTGATLLPGNLLFAIGKDGVGYLVNSTNPGGIGRQLYSATVCGLDGAWGATAYSQGVVYVPCGDCSPSPCDSGLVALSLQTGAQPRFKALWNSSDFFAGPPIIAYGAVWTFDISGTTLYAMNPANGSVIASITIPGITIEHFTTASAGDGLIFLAGNQTIYALNPSP